jgi:hypothetical protein
MAPKRLAGGSVASQVKCQRKAEAERGEQKSWQLINFNNYHLERPRPIHEKKYIIFSTRKNSQKAMLLELFLKFMNPALISTNRIRY